MGCLDSCTNDDFLMLSALEYAFECEDEYGSYSSYGSSVHLVTPSIAPTTTPRTPSANPTLAPTTSPTQPPPDFEPPTGSPTAVPGFEVSMACSLKQIFTIVSFIPAVCVAALII